MAEDLFRKSYVSGEVICREGEVGDCAYVIDSGEVEISALREGKEVVIARLSENDLFGEIALIDGKVRSATATAVAPTTLIVIQRAQVEQKISASDPMIGLFLKVLLRRLRKTTKLVESQIDKTVDESYRTGPSDSLLAVRDRAIMLLREEQELAQALTRGELEVHYQPIVDTFSGVTAGFEALIRWNHPTRGMVSPAEFIALAEQTGRIVPIGLWVLREACATLARMQRHSQGRPPEQRPLFMGVNLSARQVGEEGLVEQIREAVKSTGIEPQSLKIEVTETALMDDPNQAIAFLNQLKEIGIELAIDDFGTGYSSLSYLNRFPVDVLKIDRSFVSTMLTDQTSGKIVRTVAALAKELGMRVVAEGVEKPAELVAISELGCEMIQGYLLSRPLRAREAERVANHRFFDPPSR
jgi:EAL domain-containing protein (putative c-di-GMP-specific phosphodiesterase class I)